MKNKSIILLSLALPLILAGCGSVEDRAVHKIVSRMSLEDRIGEMILLEFTRVSYCPPEYEWETMITYSAEQLNEIISKYSLQKKYDGEKMLAELDMSDLQTVYVFYQLSMDIVKLSPPDVSLEKAKKLFGEVHIGGMLNMIGGDEATDAATWRRVMRKLDSASWAYGGKPCVYGVDEIHGTTYVSDGTLFPEPVNMAATFNRDLVRSMGEISSYENRAAGIRWIYGPVQDIAVRPTWSRDYETFGEDPYVAGELGSIYVKAMQEGGNTSVASCLKHYMGYSAPDNGIDRNPASVSLPDIREKHFEPFKKAIEAGAWSVMTNSSILNGESGVANKTYLTDWLKKGLNWDGCIVTDWADVDAMVTSQHTAVDTKEAVMLSVNAGVDMIMVPTQSGYEKIIAELVKEGKIKRSRVKDACTRIVRMKYRMGLYDREYPDPADYPLFGSEEFAQKSYEAAVESQVLLKNEGAVLPISEGSRILVVGPNANVMRTLHGGWAFTWQGSFTEKFTAGYNTIYDALCNRFGASNVEYLPCLEYDMEGDWREEKPADFSRLAAKAAGADYIVVCVGENTYAETRGSINDANLSEQQKQLVREAAKCGKKLVLVLNEGRPRLVSDIVPLCDAVVDAIIPGVYGGDALAALLSGDENFSGKLPFSYPSHPNSFTTYYYKVSEKRATVPGIYNYSADTDIQWMFGSGLSYTRFEYSDFCVDKTEFGASDVLNFSVKVTNTGERSGKETVLLYVGDVAASITPDNKRLRAFDKISLEPGESRVVEFAVPAKELAFSDRNARMTLEKGAFVATCGADAIDLNCTENWKE